MVSNRCHYGYSMPYPSHVKLVVLLLIGVAACASGPSTTSEEYGGAARPEAPVAIYVAGHGWHTGLIVPAADMQARLPALQERFGGAPYLEFGWGDRDFYQAEEITAGVALKAVLWPTAAVMHVAAVPVEVRTFFGRSEIHRLCLPSDRYDALLDFIAASFHRSTDGNVLAGGGGLYGDSSFYDAVGTYTLFNTCNTWTARGLERAGFDIGTAFKATAGSVMRYLRKQATAVNDRCGADARGVRRPAACMRNDSPWCGLGLTRASRKGLSHLSEMKTA